MHANLPGDLKADFAYTLDGAHLGEIVYETFWADAAKVTVKGVSIHPGWAKDKLVNAAHLAAKIVDTLPQATLTPETTCGRQGFLHVAVADLRMGKTRTVGFISADVTVTRFASGMIRGALDVADAHDHTVLIAETGSDPQKVERALAAMLDRRADGVIFSPMGPRRSTSLNCPSTCRSSC